MTELGRDQRGCGLHFGGILLGGLAEKQLLVHFDLVGLGCGGMLNYFGQSCRSLMPQLPESLCWSSLRLDFGHQLESLSDAHLPRMVQRGLVYKDLTHYNFVYLRVLTLECIDYSLVL